jgi:hypothetical protein
VLLLNFNVMWSILLYLLYNFLTEHIENTAFKISLFLNVYQLLQSSDFVP